MRGEGKDKWMFETGLETKLARFGEGLDVKDHRND